jgi:hypothetical protein
MEQGRERLGRGMQTGPSLDTWCPDFAERTFDFLIVHGCRLWHQFLCSEPGRPLAASGGCCRTLRTGYFILIRKGIAISPPSRSQGAGWAAEGRSCSCHTKLCSCSGKSFNAIKQQRPRRLPPPSRRLAFASSLPSGARVSEISFDQSIPRLSSTQYVIICN